MKRTVTFAVQLLSCVLFSKLCAAADLSGNYIAEISRGTPAAQYARVALMLRAGGLVGGRGESPKRAPLAM